MPHREVDAQFQLRAAVTEEDVQRIADVALVALVVFLGERGVLANFHLGAQQVDAWIVGHGVLVVRRGQTTEDQRHRHHVLNAVIAIRGIGERPGLVDDAHARFLRLDDDALDERELVLHLRMQRQRAFHRGLRVELRRES